MRVVGIRGRDSAISWRARLCMGARWRDSSSSRRARLCVGGLGWRARYESGGGTCLQIVEEELVFRAAAHRRGGTEIPESLPPPLPIFPSLSRSLPSLSLPSSLRRGLLPDPPRSL